MPVFVRLSILLKKSVPWTLIVLVFDFAGVFENEDEDDDEDEGQSRLLQQNLKRRCPLGEYEAILKSDEILPRKIIITYHNEHDKI